MKDFLPAIIALLGVVISSLIAFLTSLKIARNESAKLGVEAKKIYDSKVLEMRHSVYPALYALCSDFVKSMRGYPHYLGLNKELIDKTLLEINLWDSKHAIYFGPYTGRQCSNFRKMLKSLAEMKEGELEEWLSAETNVSMLMERVRGLELALRSDLGVYGLATDKSGVINFVLTKGDAEREFPLLKSD